MIFLQKKDEPLAVRASSKYTWQHIRALGTVHMYSLDINQILKKAGVWRDAYFFP
jgi:hypothetical protein